mmetsp:Transcript_52937/g.141479  ORF Transcript_52937/g.141479 Transcript_52937/m.141479 type:complete len:249 (-) Transcript_52937:144-890(-)
MHQVLLPMQSYQLMQYIPPEMKTLIDTVHENERVESLRQRLLIRRETTIRACIVEIFVSAGSIALYDLRRSMLIPIVNTVFVVLSAVGLHGAITLTSWKLQVHGFVTSGSLIALLLNFLMDALLTRTGLASDTLPGWVVLLVLFIPYSLNLACSLITLSLGKILSDFVEQILAQDGFPGGERFEQQARDWAGQPTCCVCMEMPKDAALVPCGHKALCMICANKLHARWRGRCPVCRSSIRDVVRVFDS